MNQVQTKKYHLVIRILHWVMAICILWALGIVLSIDGMPLSPEKIKLIGLHKSLGMTVLALVAVRLIARLIWKAPAPIDPNPWIVRASQLTTIGFYILMFAVPLAGWVYSNSKGYGVSWFNLFELPRLTGENELLSHKVHEAHEVLGYTLLVLFVIHVLGVIYHLIKRDRTLMRMI
jgi:cytochrome b561